MATTIGFFFAIVVSSVDSKYAISVHGPESALTTEMKGRQVSIIKFSKQVSSLQICHFFRCDLHSLLVGMFTALPSGAAVAIGITKIIIELHAALYCILYLFSYIGR